MKKIFSLVLVVLFSLTACQMGTSSAAEPSIEEAEAEGTAIGGPTATSLPPTETPRPTLEPLDDDSIGRVLIIFGDFFNFSQYTTSRRELENAGYRVLVASDTLGTMSSINPSLLEIEPDLLLEDVVVSDYDAFIFIGDSTFNTHPGAYPEAAEIVERIVLEAVEQGKVIGAI